MIILRQKQYATGAERAMVAMNKIPKPTIKERAQELSRRERRNAIEKINQTLGKEGLEGSSIGGFFRGRGTKSRIKMGYNTPEAVERLRKKKISEVFKDKSTSPEAIEEKLRETIGERAKKVGKTVIDKTKDSAKALYNDTSRATGKAVGFVVSHPGYAVSQAAITGVPYAVLSPAAATAVNGVTTATHPGTALWLAGKWVGDSVPVPKLVRDKNNKQVLKRLIPKRQRKSSGEIMRRPLGTVVRRWGRNADNKVVDVFEGKALKGSAKRILNTVKESHHASHPYENRIPVML